MLVEKYSSLSEFKKKNTEFLSQPIVQSFFDDSRNLSLLELSVVDGDIEAQNQLDRRFVEHFFLCRLIKYISTLSFRFSIDFNKRRRKQKENFPLLVDQPNNESNSTMLDYLSVTQEQLTIVNEGESSNIFELVVDEALYKILMKLGKKEKEVIQLILGDQLKQIEIARILNESPQNIAKTKKKALMKIRKQYEKRG